MRLDRAVSPLVLVGLGTVLNLGGKRPERFGVVIKGSANPSLSMRMPACPEPLQPVASDTENTEENRSSMC